MLRLIGMLSMLIDHIGHYNYDLLPGPIYDLMRIFGRIAMPIFACGLAQGFRRSSNLIRYFLRLLATGGLTHLVLIHIYSVLELDIINLRPNFVFDLCLGLILLTGSDLTYQSCSRLKSAFTRPEPGQSKAYQDSFTFHFSPWHIKLKPPIALIAGLVLIIIAVSLAISLDISYGLYGLLMILIFDLANKQESLKKSLQLSSWLILVMTLALSGLSLYMPDFCLAINPIQLYAIFALPLIYSPHLQTRGKPIGRQTFVLSRLGYLFYPAHFYVVLVIRLLLLRFLG